MSHLLFLSPPLPSCSSVVRPSLGLALLPPHCPPAGAPPGRNYPASASENRPPPPATQAHAPQRRRRAPREGERPELHAGWSVDPSPACLVPPLLEACMVPALLKPGALVCSAQLRTALLRWMRGGGPAGGGCVICGGGGRSMVARRRCAVASNLAARAPEFLNG